MVQLVKMSFLSRSVRGIKGIRGVRGAEVLLFHNSPITQSNDLEQRHNKIENNLKDNELFSGAQRQASLFQREVWRECKYAI